MNLEFRFQRVLFGGFNRFPNINFCIYSFMQSFYLMLFYSELFIFCTSVIFYGNLTFFSIILNLLFINKLFVVVAIADMA